MTFEQWLESKRYDTSALTDDMRTHLSHAWRAECEPVPIAYPVAHHSDIDQIVASAVSKYAGFPDRQAAIRNVADIAAAEGWPMHKLQFEIGKAALSIGPINSATRDANPAATAATALALTAGVKESILIAGGTDPRIIEAARASSMRGFDLHGLIRQSLAQIGEHVTGRINERHVKLAISHPHFTAGGPSTYSVPGILSNLANRVLEGAYMTAPAPWRMFAATRNVTDFKEVTSYRASGMGNLQQVPKGGEVKHGTFGEEEFSYSVKTFAKQFSVDRQDFINDDLRAFSEVLPSMARAAARTLNDLVATTILANAGSFWGTANANYIHGADSVLASAGLDRANQALRKMRDAEGNLLDLEPAVLLVPAELETDGRQLLESTEVSRDNSSDDRLPTGNRFRNFASLVVDARLADSAFTGYSDTGWYLFSAPSNAAVVVAFLDGMERPTMESFDLNANIDRLAMGWRVFHDFGCALGDSRASIRSLGKVE